MIISHLCDVGLHSHPGANLPDFTSLSGRPEVSPATPQPTCQQKHSVSTTHPQRVFYYICDTTPRPATKQLSKKRQPHVTLCTQLATSCSRAATSSTQLGGVYRPTMCTNASRRPTRHGLQVLGPSMYQLLQQCHCWAVEHAYIQEAQSPSFTCNAMPYDYGTHHNISDSVHHNLKLQELQSHICCWTLTMLSVLQPVPRLERCHNVANRLQRPTGC